MRAINNINSGRNDRNPVNGSNNFAPNNIKPKKFKIFVAKVTNYVKKHKLISLSILLLTLLIIGLIIFIISRNTGDTSQTNSSQLVAEYREKLPDLKQAVKDNSKDATARKEYAVALYVVGDKEKAVEQYEAAIKLDDQDAITYNNLGNVYRDLKQTNKAIEAYKKSIELNPSSVNTYVNLANVQLYVQNKPEDAIATYKQGLEALPDNYQLELLHGVACEKAGQIDEAKQIYQKILSRDADNKSAKARLESLENS